MHKNSRHLIARLHNSHVIRSIWKDTLKAVLSFFPKSIYEMKEGEHYVRFWNGSEIWVGGLDDNERAEKILGQEYVRIYLNEASQLSYETYNIVRTRLAQKINGLSNKIFIDCNPPSPLHWLYKTFIEKVDYNTNEALKNPSLYQSLLMNPRDNEENLPDGYIEETLETLPERARKRFLLGEWLKPEGAIFEHFTEDNIVSEIPKIEEYALGVDTTGNNFAAVLVGFSGSKVFIIDEYSAFRMNPIEFNNELWNRWGKYDYSIAYCDPAGATINDLITFGENAENAVEPSLTILNTLFENNMLFIHEDCKEVQQQLSDYKRDEKGRIVKENDHLVDSVRYAVYSHKLVGNVTEDVIITF